MSAETSECQFRGRHERIFYLTRSAFFINAGTFQNVLVFFNHFAEISIAALISFLKLAIILIRYCVLGATVPIRVVFIHLVSQKFLLADFVNESRGVVVSLVGKPSVESVIVVVTTL